MLTLMFNREKETCYYRHARANLIMITQDIYINFIFPLRAISLNLQKINFIYMLALLIVQIQPLYKTVQRVSVTTEPLKMTESSF